MPRYNTHHDTSIISGPYLTSSSTRLYRSPQPATFKSAKAFMSFMSSSGAGRWYGIRYGEGLDGDHQHPHPPSPGLGARFLTLRAALTPRPSASTPRAAPPRGTRPCHRPPRRPRFGADEMGETVAKRWRHHWGLKMSEDG